MIIVVLNHLILLQVIKLVVNGSHSENKNSFSAGFFPITGGQLQGSIGRNVDDSYLNLYSATYWNKGGHISLSSYQALDNPGGFRLCTGNNSDSSVKYLTGKPNGKLTWDDNDLASVAIVSKNITYTGYIKLVCGLIIQWGKILVEVDGGTIFSPSISYTQSYHVIVMGLDDVALFYYMNEGIIKLGNASSGIHYTASYISIGY